MPSVVSLFCGCGGLDLGFRELGFTMSYACDNDPLAVQCYSRNVHESVFVRDVTSPEFHTDIESLGSCDVVLGGFPCQGFSKAGPKSQGDPRNVLYLEMKRAIHTLQPRLFVAENVDGLAQNFRGAYLQQITRDFQSIGYHVEHRILDAIEYGVPQHRRRILFVGQREPAVAPFRWPSPTHKPRVRNGEFKLSSAGGLRSLWDLPGTEEDLKDVVTVRDAIGDLVKLDPSIPDHQVVNNWPKKYQAVFAAIKQGQKLCNVRHASTSVYTWQIPEVFGAVSDVERLILETISKNRRHKEYGDIPNGNPLPMAEIERLSGLTGIEPQIESLMHKGYLKDLGGRYDLKGAMFCSGLFKRPNWDEPAPTVLTVFSNPRYFLHPTEDRPFSLRECARLQGFPDSFRFVTPETDLTLVDGYRLVGNAVPPPLSRALAAAVLEHFGTGRKEGVA